MNATQLLPVALLRDSDQQRIRGHPRFQKLVFLASRRLEADCGLTPYEFDAGEYGPYSPALMETLDWLVGAGFVSRVETRTFGGDTRYDYRLTAAGVDRYDRGDHAITAGEFQCLDATATDVIGEFGSMPVSNLIGYVFDEYPTYAEHSVLY